MGSRVIPAMESFASEIGALVWAYDEARKNETERGCQQEKVEKIVSGIPSSQRLCVAFGHTGLGCERRRPVGGPHDRVSLSSFHTAMCHAVWLR